MAEHCTQLGLPAREDYIFVAKALSQVSKSSDTEQLKKYDTLINDTRVT